MSGPAPYYSDSLVTIYHGDCRDMLGDLRADAIVTDPPYGTQDLGGGYGRRQLANNGAMGHTISNDADLSAFTGAAAAFGTVLHNVGWCVVFCAARKRREADDILLATGAVAIGEAVWDKGRAGLGYTIRYAHETALVYAYGEPVVVKPLLSVLRGKRTSEVMGKRHPHEKPAEVMGRLVEFACPPNGVVFDPFCGSGSTLYAAKLAGRRSIGIETDERYCEIAAERCRQETLDLGAA